MRIGQVATQAGVSVQTVRLYERLGLIAQAVRRPSGYREYPATVVQRIQAIKRGTLDPQWKPCDDAGDVFEIWVDIALWSSGRSGELHIVGGVQAQAE